MKRFLRLGMTATVFCALMTIGARAEAVAITGGVTFGGVVAPGTNFATATSIDVLTDQAAVTCALINSCQGSYAPLTGEIIATYHDFTFNPLPAGGYNPLWSFTSAGRNYSFDLKNITFILQGPNGIVLRGTGTSHLTGFDDTAAAWSFSADATGVFAFSSTTASIPDHGQTSMLLGMALVGLALVRRRTSLGL